MLGVRLYMLGGMALFTLGMFAVFSISHLLRKILALQITGAGVFMVLIAMGHPRAETAGSVSIDPIPHALVLTGIVVSVSATALALALACRYQAETGRTAFPEDDSRDGEPSDDVT